MSTRVYSSLRKVFPTLELRVFFDVGANVGQTVDEVKASYPNVDIYAFEPVPSTFTQLSDRFASDPSVRCFALALSSSEGSADMILSNDSSVNSISSGPIAASTPAARVETMPGAVFCERHHVQHIDFLKIDTEGHDLDVLVGFSSLLQARRVSVIQVEAGLNPENKFHVPLARLWSFVEAFGYRLHGVFDQRREKRTSALRRCNAVFIAPALVKTTPAHRGI